MPVLASEGSLQFMGCDKLKHSHQGENEKYNSQRIVQEFYEEGAICSAPSNVASTDIT